MKVSIAGFLVSKLAALAEKNGRENGVKNDWQIQGPNEIHPIWIDTIRREHVHLRKCEANSHAL